MSFNNSNNMQLRNIEVRFALKKGNFSNGKNLKIIKGYSYNNNQYKDGINISAKINKEGGKSQDKADITITGLLYDDIALLSTLNFRPLQVVKNRVQVFAGYGNELSLIFEGDIIKAAASFSDPNIPFKVEAQAGYFNQIKLNEPVNIKGKIPVSKVFETLAKQSELTYKNVDIDGELDNPVLTGGSTDQIYNLGNQLGIQTKIDNGVLIVAKRNSPLHKNVFKISPQSGLLNYAFLDEKGVVARIRFNPNINFGSVIDLVSIVPKAKGVWKVYSLEYVLENYHEKFEITLKASYLQSGAVN